jgi:hypothetical protein
VLGNNKLGLLTERFNSKHRTGFLQNILLAADHKGHSQRKRWLAWGKLVYLTWLEPRACCVPQFAWDCCTKAEEKAFQKDNLAHDLAWVTREHSFWNILTDRIYRHWIKVPCAAWPDNEVLPLKWLQRHPRNLLDCCSVFRAVQRFWRRC